MTLTAADDRRAMKAVGSVAGSLTMPASAAAARALVLALPESQSDSTADGVSEVRVRAAVSAKADHPSLPCTNYATRQAQPQPVQLVQLHQLHHEC